MPTAGLVAAWKMDAVTPVPTVSENDVSVAPTAPAIVENAKAICHSSLCHHSASSLAVECRPAIEHVKAPRQTVRVNVVSLDVAHRKPKLVAGLPLGHDDSASRQNHVGHAQSEAALVEAKALWRGCSSRAK